jgi:hypothetical protein
LCPGLSGEDCWQPRSLSFPPPATPTQDALLPRLLPVKVVARPEVQAIRHPPGKGWGVGVNGRGRERKEEGASAGRKSGKEAAAGEALLLLPCCRWRPGLEATRGGKHGAGNGQRYGIGKRVIG